MLRVFISSSLGVHVSRLEIDGMAVSRDDSSSKFPLPLMFTHIDSPLQLITQGAEGLLYRTHFVSPSLPAALKYRPSKPYRHPTLDKRLTRHRILSEARILVKCRREGVGVPGVLALDVDGGPDAGGGGWMMTEWIEGKTIRATLAEYDQRAKENQDAGEAARNLSNLMVMIGEAIGKLHQIGVVHGDLTTSNMMLKPVNTNDLSNGNNTDNINGVTTQPRVITHGEVVLIDFGLAGQSIQDEDKAVDLYVLERAFGSTHPKNEGSFQEVLIAYKDSYKGSRVVLKKLEEVRMRGRKRSMVG